MITPILTTAQFSADFAGMQDFQSRVVIARYRHNGIEFDSKVKLWRGLDGSQLIHCPGCGVQVRLLTHYDNRPGCCCADCLLVERRKDDKLPSARRSKSEKGDSYKMSLASKASPKRTHKAKSGRKVA